MTHTFVLDLDDTLYLEREFVLGGFAAVDAWLRETHGLDGFLGEATARFDAGRRGDVFDEAIRRWPGLPPGIVAEMVAVYRGHAPKLSLLPDALRFLDWAAASRVQLALLSDGYLAVQQNKLRALGIGPRFGCVVLTDALGRGHWKPSPAGFERIMRELPGPAGGYVYVADNPAKDFVAPRALGWGTVRIRRPGGEHASAEPPSPAHAADREIASLAQLIAD